jgi:hypothetical protein
MNDATEAVDDASRPPVEKPKRASARKCDAEAAVPAGRRAN